MKISLFFALLLFPFFCLSQQTMSAGNQARGTKVKIRNFFQSPPGCGVLKNVSIYEAEIVDSLSIVPGKKVLFYVQCKGDTYPLVKGNHFIIKLSDESSYVEGAYNFTNYTVEELKKMKIFNLIFLAESRR